ncbi:hypothetical protein N7530_007796 [Penicillium desertorum]|uniref:Uncharacterized protein n=1 Tax=Penicillium desertorum TaxID=1303715 RepID=A0A9X0BKD5_9EURO|nr:hypothetical protein N7530_007796 [Penicillium desertorum]
MVFAREADLLLMIGVGTVRMRGVEEYAGRDEARGRRVVEVLSDRVCGGINGPIRDERLCSTEWTRHSIYLV